MGYRTTYCLLCGIPVDSDGIYQIDNPLYEGFSISIKDRSWIENIIFLAKDICEKNILPDSDVGGYVSYKDLCYSLSDKSSSSFGICLHENCFNILKKVKYFKDENDYFKLLCNIHENFSYLPTFINYGGIETSCDQFFFPKSGQEWYIKDPESIDYTIKNTLQFKKQEWSCQIPKELLEIIFEFLEETDKVKCSIICLDWFNFVHDHNCWENLLSQEYLLQISFNSFYHYFNFKKQDSLKNRKRIISNIKQILKK